VSGVEWSGVEWSGVECWCYRALFGLFIVARIKYRLLWISLYSIYYLQELGSLSLVDFILSGSKQYHTWLNGFSPFLATNDRVYFTSAR